MEKWFVAAKKADFNQIAKKYNITPVTARIIRNRDIIGDEAIDCYLNGDLSYLHDARLMKDMEKAVSIIMRKIKERKKIRVIGDYDIDGVNATYILLAALERCGADVDTDIPDRMKDGYGLNENLIRLAYDDGVDTIVTCDNGIAAVEQIRYAKELGMDVIVTDHHDIPYQEENGVRRYIMPSADAVVNPKQEDCVYPFKSLCGAGVAYKLAEVLYRECGIREEQIHEFIEFVAFATVGDVMDLVGENRIFVKTGLRRLQNTDNHGFRALLEVNQLEEKKLSAYHIGFVLGPCINASGRLDTAKKALDLLRAGTAEEAKTLALELKMLNDSRKEMTQVNLAKAVDLIESTSLKEDRILVVYIPECHESLAGIIAGRIREKYYKPSIVLTKGEEGVKGSGRSIEAYHMFEGLSECRDLLTKFGGHPLAAGLSLPEENVEELRRRMNAYSRLTEEDLTAKVSIDVPMPIDYISEEFINELDMLEPFGKANAKPVFAEKELDVIGARILGKNQNVLKLQVLNQRGTMLDAMYFGNIENFNEYVGGKFGRSELERMYQKRENRVKLSVTYYPAVNEYNGNKSIQIVVQNYQ